ncbi:MAG: threonine/serine dehydratase [Gemmatimonadota bacterium]|nr:threonine/serine dehydratase [Gemmatimonadota bacterium]
MTQSPWPVSLADVEAARARIAPYLSPTPLRSYQTLDDEVGHGIHVFVKHENHHPTNAFKVRNGLSALTMLTDDERRRGVIAATRGNHGQGLAYAGQLLGIPVTICVPVGNNPEKNEAMRAYGAELIEAGRDYDESLENVTELRQQRGLVPIHGTNNAHVIAGAGTITLEMLEQAPALEAIVIAVGGGSQAVGALTVARSLKPTLAVYAVQAEGAPAIYDSWRAGQPLDCPSADTFADGVATRAAYEMTFPALCAGLAGFVTVSDAAIAEAVRMLLRTTHNLVEGAGAVGLAGVIALHQELAGKDVGIILSGGNIDRETLRQVVSGEL